MKLTISDIKRGNFITIDRNPYMVLSVKHVHMGRGSAVVQAKIRDLRTAKVFERTLKASDSIEEANVVKSAAVFIYSRRGEYWFREEGNPASRFSLPEDILEEQRQWLKEGMGVTMVLFEGEVIGIELPVKADYKVIDAPPSIRGNTSQGGSKTVTLEGGGRVSVPLFIEPGDMIRINTETGEYAERVGS